MSRGPIAAHPVTSAVIAILTIAVIFVAVYVPLYADPAEAPATVPAAVGIGTTGVAGD
jgi:hypothetical protein